MCVIKFNKVDYMAGQDDFNDSLKTRGGLCPQVVMKEWFKTFFLSIRNSTTLLMHHPHIYWIKILKKGKEKGNQSLRKFKD